MKNKNIVKLLLASTLALLMLTGCAIDEKNVDIKDKSDENIVIKKVETSSDLLNEAKSVSTDNVDKSKVDKEKLSLNNIENFKRFKIDSQESIYLEYSEKNKSEFENALRPMIDSEGLLTDEKIYNYDEFISEYIWDETSKLGVYISDINNDKTKDIVVVYKHAGTGNFSGLNGVFLKTENGYEITNLESNEDFIANDVSLLEVAGKTYLCMTFGIQDEIYLWDENELKKIADESEFVNNDHIAKDNSIINNEISIEYEVSQKLVELKSKEISYTNSGYSDEELLITYFKIKKFLELDDKEDMADLIMYPIMYKENDIYVKVYNRDQFIENYDKIITEDVKKAAMESSYLDIFSSWRGVMIGNGEIWFTNYIIAIN